MPQPHTTTYLASDRANVVRLVHQLQRACALLLVSWQQRHLVCDRRVAHATDSTRHGKMSGVRGVVHKLDQVTAPRTTRKATYRRVVPLQVHENSKALGNGDTAVERSWMDGGAFVRRCQLQSLTQVEAWVQGQDATVNTQRTHAPTRARGHVG